MLSSPHSLPYEALQGLEPEVQKRVLNYVAEMLNLSPWATASTDAYKTPHSAEGSNSASNSTFPVNGSVPSDSEDGLEGVNSVAKKWMTRNGLTANQLGTIFSLGIDEIDLVAQSVPGTSKKTRTRNVTLLKGIAAYLSSGAARVTFDQIKEACVHYDAFDSPNHAKYLKDMISELNGSKESGYSLTPRGMTAATDLLKEMMSPEKK